MKTLLALGVACVLGANAQTAVELSVHNMTVADVQDLLVQWDMDEVFGSEFEK